MEASEALPRRSTQPSSARNPLAVALNRVASPLPFSASILSRSCLPPLPLAFAACFLAQANSNKCPGLCDWKEADTLDTVLLKIRRDLVSSHNRKLPQPAEGACYA